MEGSFLPAPIRDRDLDQDVFWRWFGIPPEHIEIAILIKDAGIDQFILHFVTVTSLVRHDQIGIRERKLRVLIQQLHIGVSGRAVEVEIVFFNVLTVVPLTISKAEQAFLKDWIDAIPKRESKTKDLLVVRYASYAVFAPTIGPRARLIMSKVVPGIAIFAVILPNRPPLSLREIGPPLSPRNT